MRMLRCEIAPAFCARRQRDPSFRCGFTLVDLLIVLVVIASLFSVAVVNLGEARRAALHLESADRLHDVGVAYQQHWRQQGRPPAASDWRDEIAPFLPGGDEFLPGGDDANGSSEQQQASVGSALPDEDSRQWWYCRGYAINDQAESFGYIELGRVLLLEYDEPVARPLADEAASEWKAHANQLELPLVNVLYGDYSVRALAPELLDPAVETNLVQRWLPGSARP